VVPSGAETEKKRVALPPVPPRRTLVPSASVACLRGSGDGTETPRQSRPVLAPSPSTSAIRVRPASPSRTAKINSGLLRSYSSVVVGGAASAAAEPTVAAAAAAGPPESPSKRGRSVIAAPRLPPKPTRNSTVPVGGQESAVISVAAIVLEQSVEQTVQTPDASIGRPQRTRLAPSPSESSLKKRPPTPRIPRSASSSELSIDKRGGDQSTVLPKDTVPTKRERVPSSPGKERQAPPASPLTRGLKRRLESGTSPDIQKAAVAEPPTMDPRCATVVTSVSKLPSASFFLRDNIVISDVATPPPMVVRGNGPGVGITLAKITPETTPKTARRSKKMRRLELENGDVDDEARDLALENAAKTKPRPRSSPCKMAAKYADDERNYYAASADAEMGEGSDLPGPSNPFNCNIIPLIFPPAPPISSIKKEREDEDEIEQRSRRSIHFRDVHIFLFGRDQGFHAVPSEGELCLGMEAVHHDEERYRLDRGEDERMEVERGGMYGGDDEELSPGEIRPLNGARMPAQSSPRRPPLGEKSTIRHIEPLTSKHRSRLLKMSGVKIVRDPVATENENIRQGRRECGCSCPGGRCLPDVCECSIEGIFCQVDTISPLFPCKCKADTCRNTTGRVEFSTQHVYEHYQMTFMRMRAIERLGDDTRGSPTLTRFDDPDEGPRHNATSYLETPPPAIYQSPSVRGESSLSSAEIAQSAEEEEKVVTPALLPAPQSLCTPPMQQMQLGGGARGAAALAGGSRDLMGDAPHPRFPVTPVYKKYAAGGGGEKTEGKEMSLARMAIFQSASSANLAPATVSPSLRPVTVTPAVRPVIVTSSVRPATVPSDDNIAIDDEPEAEVDLDVSMDTSSNYATPPEGRSPATVSLQSSPATVARATAPAEPTPHALPSPRTSPRKFGLFPSLM
ncbi:hypothetical protein PFISCL1PPCAC_22382, partial [Pristionchus fissidentatus]